MIIRTVHNKDNPYVMLKRATAQDDKLTARALGLLVYLMSKPDTWEPTIPDICARFSDIGRDQAYKIINEIFIPLRYARRVQARNQQGEIGKWITEIFEEPFTENQDSPVPDFQDSPVPDFQDSPVPDFQDSPVPDFQDHKEYRVQKENTEKQQQQHAASRFDLTTILKFVTATRKTATNPQGLAKHLERCGEDDHLIQSWLTHQPRRNADLNRMPFDAFAQQQAELEEQQRQTAWLAALPEEEYQTFFDEAARELKTRFPGHCRGDWRKTFEGGIKRMIVASHYQNEEETA